MPHLAMTIIFWVLMFPAVFLVFIPMMPVMSYLFAMSLLYGFVDSFRHLSTVEFGILTSILLFSLLVDYSAGILGAKYAGAEKKSIVAGFVGLIIGSIVFPPLGGLPGLFLAVFIAELFFDKTRMVAWKAATGSLIGAVGGVVINLILAFTFLILFVIFSI